MGQRLERLEHGRVVDERALASRPEQSGRHEPFQVVTQGRCRDVQLGLNLPGGRPLRPALNDVAEDREARWMSQRPELLPLDLQAELHLRSDRTAVAYRKWLRSLGLTFGTA